MVSEREKSLARFIASIIGRFLAIGEFWFLVWIFNPPLSTSMVWFLAILYSSLQASMVSIYSKLIVE